MRVRCDEAMKLKKEAVSRQYDMLHVIKFKCTNDCENCICGLVKDQFGTWSHVANGKEQ